MAASIAPASPLKKKNDLSLPMPPPLLHTRSGNELYDGEPRTPTTAGFLSPSATPQGSPSKSKMPPGANELPSVFENAMKLVSGSPTKVRQQLAPFSPNKSGKLAAEQGDEENRNPQEFSAGQVSPLKRSGQENTPPGFRSPKPGTPNQAALSRQEPYQTKEPDTRSRYQPPRGLTSEELEKTQSPKVKRLANVAQLCSYIPCVIPPLHH